MSKPVIVTISGAAQHGKDTAAARLLFLAEQNNHKAIRIAYADYLKYLAKAYFNWNGEKDEVGRTLLQQIGTEKVRTVNPDFWVETVLNLVQTLFMDYDYVFIPDARFPNEINLWFDYFDVFSIKVVRPDFSNGLTAEQLAHPSENSLAGFPFDATIPNKSMTDFVNSIDYVYYNVMH